MIDALLDPAGSDLAASAVDDLSRTRSWAELRERARRIAGWLHGRGVAPGGHVALLLRNRTELVELALGCLVGGVSYTPLNWHFRPGELRYIVDDSGASLLVTDVEDDALARAVGGCPVVVVGAELEAQLEAAAGVTPTFDAIAGLPMHYTSGTTGRPKGVKRPRPVSIREFLLTARNLSELSLLPPSGSHLVTGPLYHAAPLVSALAPLLCGVPLVVMPQFDAGLTLDLIEQRGVADTHMVPIMFHRLLRLPADRRASFDPSSLCTVHHGAAPISVEVKRAMIEWWGEVLYEYWGSTEGGIYSFVDSREWLQHPGTVGRAAPGFEVFAVDDEGHRLPASEVGALYVRSTSGERTFEYLGDPQKTADAHLDESAFTVGDVGYLDAGGYIFLTDRSSEIIISGGVNIYPTEIEHCLLGHPAVVDAAVFGVPDAEWGERVHAAVQLHDRSHDEPALAAALQAHVDAHLASFKVPRTIDFVTEVPRHDTGKLYRRLLRERVVGAGALDGDRTVVQ